MERNVVTLNKVAALATVHPNLIGLLYRFLHWLCLSLVLYAVQDVEFQVVGDSSVYLFVDYQQLMECSSEVFQDIAQLISREMTIRK